MCGIFGIYNNIESANLAYLGMYALQHRGQESAGISTSTGTSINTFLGMGKVTDVFHEFDFKKLSGLSSIGHVRYSTAGGNDIRNVQPINMEYYRGKLSLSHNGNLVNFLTLKNELEKNGSIFQSKSDTEIIAHLIAKSKKTDFVESVIEALKKVRGAYSLLVLKNGLLLGVRDPHGFRPLSIGRVNDSFCLASETCAFDIIEAQYIREVKPGEMIILDRNGFTSIMLEEKVKPSLCIFELIYFSRPDSIVFNTSVEQFRFELGKKLAEEHPVDADVVIGVPDSSISSAVSYAHHLKIPFRIGLIRSHYIGMTFIEPSQKIRDFGAKIKYNPIAEIVNKKRVVVVDDSVVRGTTSRKIIQMIRNAGAKEIHFRIASPPIISPCFYGIDTPYKRDLIAATNSIPEIQNYLRCESLRYLGKENLMELAKEFKLDCCYACFDENYPCEVEQQILSAKERPGYETGNLF